MHAKVYLMTNLDASVPKILEVDVRVYLRDKLLQIDSTEYFNCYFTYQAQRCPRTKGRSIIQRYKDSNLEEKIVMEIDPLKSSLIEEN